MVSELLGAGEHSLVLLCLSFFFLEEDDDNEVLVFLTCFSSEVILALRARMCFSSSEGAHHLLFS